LATLSANQVDRVEWFEQSFLYFNGGGPDRTEDQRYARPRDTRSLVLQLDYTHPLNGWGTFEAGMRSLINRFDNSQTFEVWDSGLSDWMDIDTISNRFRFDEDIHAAYLQYRTALGPISV
jgi:hypothetical protein